MIEQTGVKRSRPIRVHCRIKPFSGNKVVTSQGDQTILFDNNRDFHFDGILDEQVTQQEVFDNILGVKGVNEAFQGNNVGVVCYGQTGSGKTFTLFGDVRLKNTSAEEKMPTSEGLMHHVIHTCWELRDQYLSDNNDWDIDISMKFLEVHCHTVKDLLDRNMRAVPLHYHGEHGGYTEATSMDLESVDHAFQLVRLGLKRRTTRATKMNTQSSRSHAIVSLTVRIYNTRTFEAKVGVIKLVDLAGSERVKVTQVIGNSLYESRMINKSLLSLLNVVAALRQKTIEERKMLQPKPTLEEPETPKDDEVECKTSKTSLKKKKKKTKKKKTGPKHIHVPYRDSNLTKLLANCFGGPALTKVIITCSPAAKYREETISTLLFGTQCMQVFNKVNHQVFSRNSDAFIRKVRARTFALIKDIRRQSYIYADLSAKEDSLASKAKQIMKSICLLEEKHTLSIIKNYPLLINLLPPGVQKMHSTDKTYIYSVRFSEIPTEIVKLIQSYLSPKELCSSRLISKRWSTTEGMFERHLFENARRLLKLNRKEKKRPTNQTLRLFA